MSAKMEARKLRAATKGHLRKLVARALRGDLKRTAAAEQFGIGLRAVNECAALDKAGGLRDDLIF